MIAPFCRRFGLFCSLFFTVVFSGCAELYVIFGPGGIYGPGGSVAGGGGGGGGTNNPTSSQPSAIPGPTFSVRRIDPLLETTAGARVIAVGDMNGDGLEDFVSGSAENEPIQLHLRTSATDLTYTTFSIAGGAPISTMYDLAIADFDADAHPDVAVLVNDTGFVPVTGAQKRGAVVILFAPADAADALAWTSVVLNETFFLPGDNDGLTDFAVGEFDGVSGPDIVLGSNEIIPAPPDLNSIYLYPNPGGANARNGANWTQVQLHRDVPPFKQLEIGDVDGDGDTDVVASYPIAKSFNIRWLRNPLFEGGIGAVTAGNWSSRQVGEQRQLLQPGDEQVPGADFIAVGDIDGDGDLDVASAFSQLDLIQWFENPGPDIVVQQNFPWNVYNLGEFTTDVDINQVQLVDLNLDGRLDCFSTASGNMVGFQPRTEVHDYFTPFSIVGTNPVATIGKCAFTDVNQDGLLDIIAPLDRDGVTNDAFIILLRLTP